jgi:predicted phosphodiesterase
MGRNTKIEWDYEQIRTEKANGDTFEQIGARRGVTGPAVRYQYLKNEVTAPPHRTVGFRVVSEISETPPPTPLVMPPTPEIQVDPETIPHTDLPEQPAYAHNAYRFGHEPEPKTPATEILRSDFEFRSYVDALYEYFRFNEVSPQPPEPKPILDGAEFTVIASDLHVPYENAEAVRWMVKRTYKKANRLVIGGDLADMFYFSKYMKFKNHFTATEEMARVKAQINLFAEAFDEVVIMRGNHDDRFIKWMARRGMEPEVMDVFRYLFGVHAMHPIYVLAADLKNVKVVESISCDYAEFSYLGQFGDCVVSHAEKYSKIPNKAVGDVIQSLKSFHEARGLIKPFRVVVQAHTHQAGKTWNDFGVVGIENGCLSALPDYSGGSKTLPHRSPVLGYTELHQVNGVSDLEKTNFIPYQT